VKKLTVLIPTLNRQKALTVTLTSLCFQNWKNFDIVIADQSEDGDCYDNGVAGSDDARADGCLGAVTRLLRKNGHLLRMLRNHPPRGMAQQRQFLLEHSQTPYSLFLDDDLVLEPYVIRNMLRTLESEACGFAGCAVIGLSHLRDVRPHQQLIEFWDGRVRPEQVVPGSREWERHQLHSAANLYHVQERLRASPDSPLRYKVAWIGGCVTFDTEKLLDVGGFGFWKELPAEHCGEDVLAQLRVARKYGGCGLLPSGVYHQELQTRVPRRKVNAPEYLDI
jgi:glycosyltransferase involved in cell wall biosynthesis